MMQYLDEDFSHNVAATILEEAQVKRLLPALNVQGELKKMFLSLSKGNSVQSPQTVTVFPDDGGDFISYMGVIREAQVFGSKLSPYIVTQGAPIITAWTQLMSQKTGQPLLTCDAGLLTTERTAGTTALAVEYLAKKDSKNLAVIGSGAIALAHLRHVLDLRSWEKIQVYSPSLGDNPHRKEQFLALDQRVEFAQTSDECIDNADVILLCTSSGTPVIGEQKIKSSALITSISTNVANAHEISPAFLSQLDVYCDYKLTTPDSAGEMKLAKSEHQWSKDAICGDLTDLVNERCLPDHSRPVFFRSIGLGLEDIAMAYGIWKLSQKNS